MTPITFQKIEERIRERADMENGNFVSTDEIRYHVNNEINDLYAKMVNVEEGQLFTTVSPTLVQIGNNAYQLPSDFMRLVDVNIYAGARWVPAYEADTQDYLQLLTRQYQGNFDVQYFLKLNQQQGRYELFLFPAKEPASIGVRYIPAAPQLTLDSDTLKWPSNWVEPVITAVAAKCLLKEESEATHLLMETDRATARVLKDIRAQKVAEIKTLRDVAGRNRRRRRFILPWG